ncbi:MAG: cytochrome P460 [Acidimicrobiia bacterium]|nr:cytochrome P460 [Acidimicrobiia bacterium]
MERDIDPLVADRWSLSRTRAIVVKEPAGAVQSWLVRVTRTEDGRPMKESNMTRIIAAICLTLPVAACGAGAQPAPAGDGPHYVDGTTLVRPADYREWPFLGSGLGMTYEPAEGLQATAPQLFTNVFVNPSSYRAFMDTGRWQDGTIFILEFRNSSGEASINRAGRFQTNLVGLEAEVKDSRFPDGWAYFNFGDRDSAPPLTGTVAAGCVKCHTEHTAVERTFVQFYPTLLDVARAKGTLNPGF